ncbi:MAG: Penicillin-binding protein 4* [Firmicutes bacterium]|nr:Penicillin-binding protein 4* [Bacillota bacterium]
MEQNNTRWTQFDQFVSTLMAEEPIVGLGVTVTEHGKTIYCRGFGVADLETKAAVTEETIFGIASVTKSFTALAVMRLVEQGLLSLDASVCYYLPAFRLREVPDITAIKLRHLLTHSTGLPPMRRRQDLMGFASHLEFLAHEQVMLLGAPGQYVSYCNDTFLLLGAVIEAVTGSGFRQHITDTILKPLGMKRSTLEDDVLSTLGNLSTPYTYQTSTKTHQAEAWPVLNNYAVGGGVRSCLRDLLKYGQVYLGATPLAHPATIHTMWSEGLPVGKNASYGFGLRYSPAHGGVTLVEHGGGQPGVSSHFGFVPERGIVAAVLANVTNVSAARVWLAAVNTALGLPLHYNTNEELPQLLERNLEPFVGTYTSAEGGQVAVAEDNGKPVAKTEGLTHALIYAGGTTFFFNYRGQRVLRFFLDAGEKAWAVQFGLRILRR